MRIQGHSDHVSDRLLEIEISDLIQVVKTLLEGGNHLLASLSLLDGGIVFHEQIVEVDIVTVKGSAELSLRHVLGLVDEEGHDGLWHHVVHGLAHGVEVRDDQVFDDVGLKLGPGGALTWVLVLSSHVGGHVWEVNRLDVFLHVLLDLVVVDVLHPSMSVNT